MILNLVRRIFNLVLCLILLSGGAEPPFPISADDVSGASPGSDLAIGNHNSDIKKMIDPSEFVENKDLGVQITSNLWVDASSGNDAFDGLTRATAFRSIQRAADVAGPGTLIHILPGTYRETVRPMSSGRATARIIYRAENGPGTAIIKGSERTDTFVWTQMTTNSIGLPEKIDPGNIYFADLSGWALESPPRFVVEPGRSDGAVIRLPLAREPDWQVATEWKYAEFWWSADGGSSPAGCDPVSNQNHDCDISSRSTLQLTDRTNDSEPVGVEQGNLMTLGNLTGASLIAMDTDEGHYVYHRTIVADDVAAGKITVDQPCVFDYGSGKAGLGWGSKYYVEDHPALIDTPGEWWYDAISSRLYLWPPGAGNPALQDIEISRRALGFDLTDRSYITIDGLSMEFFNDDAVSQDNNDSEKSYSNIVRNTKLRFANVGIELGQGVGETTSNITTGFILESSDVGQMDSRAIRLNYWWPGGTADSFTFAGIVNTMIRHNVLHDLGFRSDGDNAMGVLFNHADRLSLEDNYIHHVAQNGVAFSRSVIQSSKERGFSPQEIKTGGILIKDNVFEKACLLNSDCGELKIQGSWPDNHVFRDTLITGNVFRNTFGWTYISEKRARWSGGTGSVVQGMGGFGLYIDNASGIHAYRNIAYNNSFSNLNLYEHWSDGNLVIYNNIAANSLHGIYLGGDNKASINTQIANNIVVNNEGYGVAIFRPQGGLGNFFLDHDLFFSNGWRAYEQGGLWQTGDMVVHGPDGYYQTLAAIQASTPWEDHGVEGDPAFLNYDFSDHALFDGSWPDFQLTDASTNAWDRGTAVLPDSLTALLDAFKINDLRWGTAYDIGRYELIRAMNTAETGFSLQVRPTTQLICAGGKARYSLQLDQSHLPYSVFLSVSSPSPLLGTTLSSQTLTGNNVVTLTVIDEHTKLILRPALTYTIRITATGGGYLEEKSVRLFIGGTKICRLIFPGK